MIDKKKKKKRIEKHIKALETSYDNVIEVLKEAVDKDEKTGKVKLKDTQKRLFSEGIRTTAETATYLLDLINAKQNELDSVDQEGEETEGEEKKIVEPKVDENYPTAKYLN